VPIPTHLNESDYQKPFPADVDQFPTVINEQHYIDAWLINSAFNSLLAIEQFLLQYQSRIEAPDGQDVLGLEGALQIAIPPALYGPYKFAEAWDSNLLAENIAINETIFGVVGSLSAAPPFEVVAITWDIAATATFTEEFSHV